MDGRSHGPARLGADLPACLYYKNRTACEWRCCFLFSLFFCLFCFLHLYLVRFALRRSGQATENPTESGAVESPNRAEILRSSEKRQRQNGHLLASSLHFRHRRSRAHHVQYRTSPASSPQHAHQRSRSARRLGGDGRPLVKYWSTSDTAILLGVTEPVALF